MKVEISIGDAIDKYNILEIKQKNITDPEKLNDISTEISLLEECKDTINKNKYYYNILTHVNENIWNLTNQIKKLNYAENAAEFSQISHEIFDYNQKRNRLKHIFNVLCNPDEKKERKISDAKSLYLQISDLNIIYKKISEINSLCIDYDYIFVGGEFFETVKKYVNAPNIRQVVAEENNSYTKEIQLNEYSLPAELVVIFEYGLSKEEIVNELINANKTIEELQNKLNEAIIFREKYESYSKTIEDKNKELEARANELEARANELQQKFQAIDQYKTELENRANNLQHRANEYEARVGDLQNRVNELGEFQVNYQNRIKFLEDELSQYKN